MNVVQPPHPKILVVDDEEQNVHLLAELLEPKGYKVLEALSGEEALRLVAEAGPDVVLLDLMMPGMDGYEVCRRLKNDAATRHIPVIIVTGLSDHETNICAIEAGADDFLIKPIDSVLLDARLRNSVGVKTLQDELLLSQRRLEGANAELEQRVRRRTLQLERARQATVFSLARLAESRDPETGEHLERIQFYVRELAFYLAKHPPTPEIEKAMNTEFISVLFHSCPLHDIGKVGIPDRILLKPGKLTVQEFDLMKEHTVIGGDTLAAANAEAGEDPFLAMGGDIAYYHHERWDGTGYPKGLKGSDIPLAARLVALTDVYDALTSKRPYKEPFSHEKSRGIIVESRGSHLDPNVVDAFFACEERVIRIRGEHQDSGVTRMHQMLEALDGSL